MPKAPALTSAPPARTLALWCPSWPVEAARRSLGSAAPPRLALIAKGRVIAVSPEAEDESVTIGLRLREAQTRCPDLTVLAHDPAVDERWFAPVLQAVERVVPHVHLIEQGALAVRITGAARFYGSEDAVVELLLDQLAELHLDDVRMAVADGVFLAEQVARNTTVDCPVTNLPSPQTAAFLRTLPVSTVAAAVGDPALAETLRRMGIRNLGAFAKLPRAQVHSRFGEAGRRAHQLAWGEDSPVLPTHPIPDDFTVQAVCEHPSNDAALITRISEPIAATLTDRLRTRSLVCHEVRITLTTSAGHLHERTWRHAWPFTTHDITERVRWQLEDLATHAHRSDRSDGVTVVEIVAESPTQAAAHAPGLWGERPDQHITQMVVSLQRDLGHGAVRSATLAGGRLLHERHSTRPWGDSPPRHDARDRPWPGTLPGPRPATVFDSAQPALVHDAGGNPVVVDARGGLEAAPATWRPAHDDSRARQVVAWNGPWPVRQHWWQKPLALNRFQIVDDSGEAWLLLATDDGWWIEARYD
ncbi:DNA polymerase Y family protein [Yimella sp. cx-51]|uniref:DNA polymerase Y family protein n=1 Tax=Yimella sp. cx-51 TaxID=2770551 RepID=UPI00165E5B28|nr:DNA polymerase Y family protein [Yimella sp. cx-51]MBC9958287.1 DNA polymerase Y family protein [Yimella sp. cx-51]QTH38689.1 DNA polymerase Y family protein [Yimella sp. cx-51]